MKEFFSVIKKCALFQGVSDNELEKALRCMNAYVKHYKKNEIVRHAGGEITESGILVKGACMVAKFDADGNRVILREIKSGRSFGESLAVGGIKNSPITITAVKNSTVIFIPIMTFIESCTKGCKLHTVLIKNLVTMLAQKNIALHIKHDILSKKTIRQKLIAYFEYESDLLGTKAYKISFTREELADFLGVHRSSLSRELSKMQEDGILTYKKNTFVLKSVSSSDRYI